MCTLLATDLSVRAVGRLTEEEEEEEEVDESRGFADFHIYV